MHYYLLWIIVLIIFPSCTQMPSMEPVGSKPASIEASMLKGTWISYDSNSEYLIIIIEILDKDEAVLEMIITLVEDNADEGDKYLDIFYLREYNEFLFWNLYHKPHSNNSSLEVYYWGHLRLNADSMEIWLPSDLMYNKLRENGLRVFQDGEITITEKLQDKHMDLIINNVDLWKNEKIILKKTQCSEFQYILNKIELKSILAK